MRTVISLIILTLYFQEVESSEMCFSDGGCSGLRTCEFHCNYPKCSIGFCSREPRFEQAFSMSVAPSCAANGEPCSSVRDCCIADDILTLTA